MFGLASQGQPNFLNGPLLGNSQPQQLSALTPNSLVMGSVPSYLQTAGAIGNTGISPLAALLAHFGVK